MKTKLQMEHVTSLFIDFLKANSNKYMVIDLIPLKTKELKDKLENKGNSENEEGEYDEEEDYDEEQEQSNQIKQSIPNKASPQPKNIKNNNQLYVPKI